MTRQRKTALLTLGILLVTLLATSAPQLQAAPGSDIWTHYYDCDLSIVGEKFRGCDSSGYNWGQLSGYYKEIESCSCEGTTCQSSWYKWNGSTWVYIGTTAPSPDC
jgi:hypothetical protein